MLYFLQTSGYISESDGSQLFLTTLTDNLLDLFPGEGVDTIKQIRWPALRCQSKEIVNKVSFPRTQHHDLVKI